MLDLGNWIFDKDVKDESRIANVSIVIKYPDVVPFSNLAPKERIIQIDKHYKDQLKKILSLKLFEDVEITGSKKRPQGIKGNILFLHLNDISNLSLFASVNINSITGAKKVEFIEPHVSKYYCVKMTVVIEIEGVSNKMESIEERMVLIKATSREDAYAKLDSQKEAYAEPYLNSDGRFVKWRIDSFDDYYETDISTFQDLENPEGVEVYSKFKTRKRKLN